MWSKEDWDKSPDLKGFVIHVKEVVYKEYYVRAKDKDDAVEKWYNDEATLDDESDSDSEILEIEEVG